MKTLGTTLKGELMAGMKGGGPAAALDVCSSSAQSLTGTVQRNAGVAVGRSSLRLRNPANAGPAWVTTWLKEQDGRAAAEVHPASTVATNAQGEAVVRIVAPLPIEAPCLICHGAEQGRAPDLQAALSARYPEDQANGYALGDLRGAVWAEAPVIETGLTLPLDGASKWQLDDSTRTAMTVLRGVVATAPTDLDDAHKTAASIDTVVSTLINECTMKGTSHDHLHTFLTVLFPAIKALKESKDVQAATDARDVLLTLVVQFDAAFE
jgi:hypothetical protein